MAVGFGHADEDGMPAFCEDWMVVVFVSSSYFER